MAGLTSLFILNAGLKLSEGIQQSSAIEAQSGYQAKMLEINKQFAEFQGEDAIKRGEKTVIDYNQKLSQLMGTQRTSYAGQGVSVGEGSAAQVAEDTAVRGAQDVVTIRSNAWREAWGYRVQAMDLQGQADLTRMGGQFQSRQSLLTGIGGAAESGIKAYSYSKAPKSSELDEMIPPWKRK